MSASETERHFPGRAPIEGYGQGGFRFAGISHRGSLLIVPSGIYAWPPASVPEIDEASLARVFTESGEIDLLMIGTGREPVFIPAPLRAALKKAGIAVDFTATGPATSTYNLLLDEGRRVAAALIAVK